MNIVFIPNISLGDNRNTPYHYSIKSWKKWAEQYNDVKVIATQFEDIVGVSQNNIVSLTYHPELTNDNYYLEWLLAFMKEGKYVGTF